MFLSGWSWRVLYYACACSNKQTKRAEPSLASRAHQLSAHSGQGPALQGGDVHLGEADPGRDGVLIQLMEEPKNDDLALQFRQCRYEAGKRQQILWFLPVRRCSHQIAKAQVGFGAGRLVQRYLTAAGHRSQRLQDLLLTQLQTLGQLARSR